jgi:pimeloyl-ACP methyl ester carboxylesterase
MAMWHSFIRRFSSDYKIVVFDFPNQGKGRVNSGPPKVTLEEQLEILSKVIDDANLSNSLTICAASWGGVVAAAFAAKYPRRAKRLILASLSTRPNKKMIETIKLGAQIDSNNRKEMAQALIKSFGDNLPDSLKNRIINQFINLSKEKLQAFYEHGLFVISSKEISEVIDLSTIKAKTILINGDKDTIVDLEDVKLLASQIPKAKLKIIKGAGHFLHLEKEDILNVYAEILAERD